MKSHANRGKPFERLIRNSNDEYERRGVAKITKVPTEFIPLRNAEGRVVSVKVEEKTTPDFIGRFRGFPVLAEAKSTNSARISFSEVKPHQAAFLDEWCAESGAIGLVVVCFNNKRYFSVPWQFWRAGRDAWKEEPKSTRTITYAGMIWDTPGKASVSPEELLQDWEVSLRDGVFLPYLKTAQNVATYINKQKDMPQGCITTTGEAFLE